MRIKFIKTISFILALSLTCASYLQAGNSPATNNDGDTIEAAAMAAIRTQLIGQWENPFFTLEFDSNKNGFLKYHFREDGTYTKILGGGELPIEEEGTWEVSEDGKYLLMRSQNLCDGQPAMVTQVATIKHLSLDEMVLQQSVCVDGVAVSGESKDFFFNKY